jgi:ribosomal-protein-alanine N-acetyltransferase
LHASQGNLASEMAMIPASLRPATLDDVPQIQKIESASYPAPWTSAQFETELGTPHSRFLVLTDDETDEFILGYVIYWVQVEGVSLLNVAVHPEWRGLGNAERLMRAMINETVRDEIPRIILEVRASNAGAIRLYHSLGFIQTHERKKFYQDGETALVMELKTSELSSTLQ